MGVLDDMTKGITDRKAAKSGPKLTPVGAEVNPLKPSLASIPNDVPTMFMSNEQLGLHRDSLRAYAADLLRIADGLDVMLGVDPAAAEHTAEVTEREVKLAEKEADRKAADREKAAAGDKKAAKRVEDSEEFAARYAAQQAEAQAAIFTASDDAPKGPVAPTPSPTGDWVCPEHGAEDIESMTSRLRPAGYLACAVAGCGEYEPKE